VEAEVLSPAPGVIIQDKYQLEAPLARGGMGSVWIATHRELAVKVAVKFIAPDLASSLDGVTRFEREARAAAHLDSRHVVQIRDYGMADGTPFLVMELLKGESLEQRLARVRRMTLGDTLAILQQLARGLRKAHEQGIVHRDLKPGNIFIARTDDEDVVKILDFGIAKLSRAAPDANATRTGMVMGSVHYASPEQLRSSKDTDARSDIWSVGVILFRMIVGRLPFTGHEIPDIIVKVCAEPIPTPRSIVPDLSHEIDTFFLRALARSPAERFQTITDLVDAFAAIALHAPAAEPPTLVFASAPAHPAVPPPQIPAQSPSPAALLGGLSPSAPVPVASADVDVAQKTAPWTSARIPPVNAPGAHDNTLHGAGGTSVTAHPVRTSARSRRFAIPLAAASAVVIVGGAVSAVVLRSSDTQLSGAATTASVPAAQTTTSPTPLEASAEAPVPVPPGGGLPGTALPTSGESAPAPQAGSSTASASALVGRGPPGVATDAASTIPTQPPAPPITTAKPPPRPAQTPDRDVEMP
jgi:eukaryotic-like serine/threonine-protein kinase